MKLGAPAGGLGVDHAEVDVRKNDGVVTNFHKGF
jgi:hypothetical protein